MNTLCVCHEYIMDKELEAPYKPWNTRKPKIEHLRVFGSIVHLKMTRSLLKVKERSTIMLFLG